MTKEGRVTILDFGLAEFEYTVHTSVWRRHPHGAHVTWNGNWDHQLHGSGAGEVRNSSIIGATSLPSARCCSEMLVGRNAFQRSSSIETMHAILNDEPPEVSAASQLQCPTTTAEHYAPLPLKRSRGQRFQSSSGPRFCA